MSITRKRGLRALVAGAAMALLLGPGGIAQAEIVEVEFDLSAVLVLGAIDLSDDPIEGITLVGDWDDETGAFTDGVLTIPGAELEVESELGDVVAAVNFSASTVTGTVPPDGSEGEVTTSMDISIGIALNGTPFDTCTIPTFDLALVTNLLVDEVEATIDLVAVDDVFSVGEATCGLGALVADLLNAEVGLPTSGAYICLATDVGLCDPPEPGPGPDPDPSPEPVTPAEARPAFTG